MTPLAGRSAPFELKLLQALAESTRLGTGREAAHDALERLLAQETRAEEVRLFLPSPDGKRLLRPVPGSREQAIAATSPLMSRLREAGGLVDASDPPPERLTPTERHAIEGIRPRWFLPVQAGASPPALLVVGRKTRGEYSRTDLARMEALARRLGRALPALGDALAATSPQEIDRERAEFLAEMAHQIMTPLTAIKAATEVLQAESSAEPLDHGVRSRLTASVARSVTSLENVAALLLEYGELRMGRTRLALEVADLEALARHCAAVVDPTLLRRRQTLTVEAPGPLPPVALDVRRMEQVVLNLLSNAIKFSPPGSTLALRITSGDRGVALSVEDACGGLTPREVDRLFQGFALRDRPIASGRARGAGLGLAIAKGIVELHNGTVTVENSPGKGCTFVVSLPFTAPETA